jgi:hypothetical protein
MRARTLIGAGLAVALAGAALSYELPASAQGWGMMGGYGPGYGHMGGWGGGPGAGQWNCPAFAQGGGYGPGGYGPSYHMRGWGGGYGPGMMQGYGYGPGYNRSEAQSNLNLTTDDVKARIERWLTWRDNPRLKVGEVKEKDADTITADIVTKDNSLVERIIVDRHTGFTRRDNG